MGDNTATLLKEEYFYLQSTIEKFDEKSLQIKGWSATVCLAGAIAATVSDKMGAEMRVVAYFVCCAGALAFWLIDAAWKDFQRRYFPRVRQIEEAFLSNDIANIRPLQISSENWARRSFTDAAESYCAVMLLPHVALPHVLIAIGCGWLAMRGPPIG